MDDIYLHAGAQAFGDGAHPTTQGVLAALRAIDPAEFTPAMACDMGTGSGIVAFAVLAAFGCPVVAVDLAASAVAAVRENAQRNGVAARILPIHADGFDHADIAAHAPFDLLVMNILAEPLMRLCVAADTHLAAGGVLILSGILVWQETPIREAYAARGLELTSRLTVGDWVTHIWQKPEL
ncbi:MAG: 50S ribosomal protein L11 methyltransferase [Pseudomonadota bacterium]